MLYSNICGKIPHRKRGRKSHSLLSRLQHKSSVDVKLDITITTETLMNAPLLRSNRNFLTISDGEQDKKAPQTLSLRRFRNSGCLAAIKLQSDVYTKEEVTPACVVDTCDCVTVGVTTTECCELRITSKDVVDTCAQSNILADIPLPRDVKVAC